MSKTALSVTLEDDNLLWLKARARAQGSRSLSATLDALLRETRSASPEVRSVVGRVRILEGDAGLEAGRREIRELFERSLARGVETRRRRA